MFKIEVSAKVSASKSELEQLICKFEEDRGNKVVENSFKWKHGEERRDPYNEHSDYVKFFDGVEYMVDIASK